MNSVGTKKCIGMRIFVFLAGSKQCRGTQSKTKTQSLEMHTSRYVNAHLVTSKIIFFLVVRININDFKLQEWRFLSILIITHILVFEKNLLK